MAKAKSSRTMRREPVMAEPTIAYAIAVAAAAADKDIPTWIYEVLVSELVRSKIIPPPPEPEPLHEPEPPPEPIPETREERDARERLGFFERHKALPREDGTRTCPKCYKQRRDDTAACQHCGDVDPCYPPAVEG